MDPTQALRELLRLYRKQARENKLPDQLRAEILEKLDALMQWTAKRGFAPDVDAVVEEILDELGEPT